MTKTRSADPFVTDGKSRPDGGVRLDPGPIA
jgi:hypothetical protein